MESPQFHIFQILKDEMNFETAVDQQPHLISTRSRLPKFSNQQTNTVMHIETAQLR